MFLQTFIQIVTHFCIINPACHPTGTEHQTGQIPDIIVQAQVFHVTEGNITSRVGLLHSQVQVCIYASAAAFILNTWKPMKPHKCKSQFEDWPAEGSILLLVLPPPWCQQLSSQLPLQHHADSPSLLPDTRAADVTHNNARGVFFLS